MKFNPPKKHIGAGAVFFNESGDMLIVKPVYKEGWLIPGGSVEKMESPRHACEREVKEELNIDINIKILLCVDSVQIEPNKPFSLQFTFYGGILNKEQVSSIALPNQELSEFIFVSKNELSNFFPERKILRYNACFQAIQKKTVYYLENGKLNYENCP